MKEYSIHLKCETCGKEYVEYIKTPMNVQALVARLKGWVCSNCSSKRINLTEVFSVRRGKQ